MTDDVVYPRTYFEALRAALRDVEAFREDDSISKEAALKSAHSWLCFLLRKMVAAPTSTGFSVFRSEDPNDL
jgi:hypothetical protein